MSRSVKFRLESIDDLMAVLGRPAQWRGNEKFLTGSNDLGWICSDRESVVRRIEAQSEFFRPFPTGVSRIAELRSQLQIEVPKSVRRKPVMSDCGDELDLDRLRAGQVETMWRVARRQSTVAPKVVTIAIEASAYASVPALALAWRGAAALALSDALSEAGYMVEIVAAREVRLWDAAQTVQQIELVLKPAGGVVDVETLANGASGLMIRGLLQGFSCKVATSRVGQGLALPLVAECPANGVIARPSVCDLASAKAWLAESLASLTGEGDN